MLRVPLGEQPLAARTVAVAHGGEPAGQPGPAPDPLPYRDGSDIGDLHHAAQAAAPGAGDRPCRGRIPCDKENDIPLGSDGACGGFPGPGTVVASTRQSEGY
ncbi:hypothetical protein SSP531S_45890 [Streptomyces spongiicola]|uniref:Uncharacterized protein n=1 Tax=Streptomyces spongiicola TaxID=1690221 RepID=A0A388T4L2_9ACTN|nr:hypothetical protein SSP531S_45890 [Streptomyces spongiicola]